MISRQAENPDNVVATFRSPTDAADKARGTPSWRRKDNRLPSDRYIWNAAYSLTLCTEGRVLRFNEPSLVRSCEAELNEAAAKSGFTLLAYAFMPDHLHILASGTEEARLPSFTKLFKQRTAFYFKKTTGQSLWQKSYYDHVLRHEEDLEVVALYIAGNAVRAGLVDEWWQFPYWGGVLLTAAVDGDLKVAATSSAGDPR